MQKEKYVPKYPVQTLSKALDVVEYLKINSNSEGISISELSEKLNMGKSSVHRLLDTLLSYNYVEKSSSGLSYKLGWGIFDAGSIVPEQHSIDNVNVVPYLKNLCNEFNETVNLGVIDNNEIVIIHKIEPNIRLRANVKIGGREPLYTTSLGKVFLSELSEKEIYNYYKNEHIVPFTNKTILTAEKMVEELKISKSKGYALDNEELLEGLRCVAMPIRDYREKVVASISVSGPILRMTDERIENIVKKLKNICFDLSKYLGF